MRAEACRPSARGQQRGRVVPSKKKSSRRVDARKATRRARTASVVRTIYKAADAISPAERLAFALDLVEYASHVAADVGYPGSRRDRVPETDRERARQVLEILSLTTEAAREAKRAAIGHILSGARKAAALLASAGINEALHPRSNDEILLDGVRRLVEAGTTLRKLAPILRAWIVARGAVRLSKDGTDRDAARKDRRDVSVRRAIARYGDDTGKIHAPATVAHRMGASPRTGAALCRCADCIAARIIAAARRALLK